LITPTQESKWITTHTIKLIIKQLQNLIDQVKAQEYPYNIAQSKSTKIYLIILGIEITKGKSNNKKLKGRLSLKLNLELEIEC